MEGEVEVCEGAEEEEEADSREAEGEVGVAEGSEEAEVEVSVAEEDFKSLHLYLNKYIFFQTP